MIKIAEKTRECAEVILLMRREKYHESQAARLNCFVVCNQQRSVLVPNVIRRLQLIHQA